MSLRGRLAAVAFLGAGLFGVGLLGAPAASAHPLGNFTINHYDDLVLGPGNLRLTYVLDMAEIPTFQARTAIDANGDGTVTDPERSAWAAAQAGQILPQLQAAVDGKAVRFSSACTATMVFRPGQGGLQILRMVAVFDAPLPASGNLRFLDGTFPGRIGWKEVTARGADGATISGASVPATSVSRGLLRYPTDLLSNPLDVTEASLTFSSTGGARPAPACPTGGTGSPTAAKNSFASLITWKLTPVVLAVSLLLAFLFGVLHALGPGHGKTITAAYLVGSGARVRQAVAVGGAVSLMHTLSVLTLGIIAAVVSSAFPSEQIYPWLTVATGAMALGLGGYLLMMRIQARRHGLEPWHGHTHPGDEPSAPVLGHPATAEDALEEASEAREVELVGAVVGHRHRHEQAVAVAAQRPEAAGGDGAASDNHRHASDHDHGEHPHGIDDHALTEPQRPMSRKGLAALAVAGGILPSPTALVVLLGAISAHRVGYGLSLIVAFSVGLAAALIVIALLALRAKSFVSAKLGSRTAGWLPIISAVVIVGFGWFFLVKGITQVV